MVYSPSGARDISFLQKLEMGTDSHAITYSLVTEGSWPGDKATYCVKLSPHLSVGSSLRKYGAAPSLPHVPSLVHTRTTLSLFYHGFVPKNASILYVKHKCFDRFEITSVSNQTCCVFWYGEGNFFKIWSPCGEH